MAINQTIIIGNAGRDPELRYTPSGRAVTDVSVAVTRVWSDRTTGERKEKTVWFKVTVWGPRAETVSQYLRKGMPVFAIGEIDSSAYLAADGTPKSTNELNASRIEWFARGTNGQGGEAADEPTDNDLPF